MPTRHTAAIEDNPEYTLAEFARHTAMAFLIEGREGIAVKRVRELDPYRLKQIYRAQADIAELEEMTPADIERICAEQHQKAIESWQESEARFKEKNDRYRAMLAKVKAWDAPKVLAALKKCMIEQIELSMYTEDRERREPELPGDWHASRLEWAKKDLEHALKRKAQAEKHLEHRNAFVAALFDEFPLPGDE